MPVRAAGRGLLHGGDEGAGVGGRIDAGAGLEEGDAGHGKRR